MIFRKIGKAMEKKMEVESVRKNLSLIECLLLLFIHFNSKFKVTCKFRWMRVYINKGRIKEKPAKISNTDYIRHFAFRRNCRLNGHSEYLRIYFPWLNRQICFKMVHFNITQNPVLVDLNGIVSDYNNIFLWQKSKDMNKKILSLKFQLVLILRLQVMHDFVLWHYSINHCVKLSLGHETYIMLKMAIIS